MRKNPSWLALGLLTLAAPTAYAERAWYEKPQPDVAAPSTKLRQAVVQDITDDLPHRLGEQQKELKAQALQMRLEGRGQPGRVQKLANGKFVELELQRTDRIFVILVEYGTQIHPVFGNPATNPGGNIPGPLHNAIPGPDRTVDNTTIWQPDYNREHFEKLYFDTTPGADSVANFYKAASSGRYTVSGTVSEWVKVPYNAARYGNNLCGSSSCSNSIWPLVSDAIKAWTNAQLAAGKTPAEIKAYLDTFDTWDRYDYDGDGNFDEPDGYIDHFQIVHAGMGEEVGGGAQGPNAVWSHRWFAYSNGTSADGIGPAYNQNGGTRFGTGIDKWVGDYTIQPENGGLGVFAHEYGHDLGLPDHYDTTNAADNGTGFWTIMSSGSYLNDGTKDIGSRPGDFFAWDKLQLGWLDYATTDAGLYSYHNLGPAEVTSQNAKQALVVKLPGKPVVQPTTAPFEGQGMWQGGQGNNLDRVLEKTVKLPNKKPITFSFQTWFDIEEDWDYAYVALSVDGGPFTNLASPVSRTTNPWGNNLGNGITGTSGGWIPLEFDLSAYAGKSVTLKIRYKTDAAEFNKGFLVDYVQLWAKNTYVFGDDGEWGHKWWDKSTFFVTDGTNTLYDNYYLAEWRQFRGYDEGLATGPYNFGFSSDGLVDWAERYSYNPGLLITYWDTSQSNNNVSQHPGSGRILPIDSRPQPLQRSDGRYWSGRVQTHDATFGLEPSFPLSLKPNGFPRNEYASQPAVPVFNDTNEFWYATQPYGGVKVPKTGTIIEVLSTNPAQTVMQVQVRPVE
ncbi:M6 family metalloprotease domain-containing protein [Corallococcus exiguus]|uniref:immune inhibitor A domain-containing protein n=1 Tax=Corallococcus TaxID=83461 RepID=UPI000EDAB23C|nr:MULTISPECIES: immune inhibitor A domain-containing protein [Corallococcus]NNC20248.1 M6 family metalloprotease domain-containing protein [Corallococcus exiguus]RKI09165.1 M6 family metalloprotease domain-containing protein [Corallococcus sp. AB030]RUO89788.1 M6 family metalloprotease domain-containing protein [Corallococcus sp. AB018]